MMKKEEPILLIMNILKKFQVFMKQNINKNMIKKLEMGELLLENSK